MAVGRRRRERQDGLFVPAGAIRSAGNPFYEALNRLLEANGFDDFAEELCREFHAKARGRPSVAPGVYFRMLMVGYLDGIDSDRGIAWRCADSISVREFLGYGLSENPPDHSSLSRNRRRLSLEFTRRCSPGSCDFCGTTVRSGRDPWGGFDDGGGERGDAGDGSSGRRYGLPGVPGEAGCGVGHRFADAR